MGIDHGGAPALGAQQLLRPGARAQGRRSTTRLALCRPSAGTLKLGLLGIPSLERMGGGYELRLRLLGHLAEILANPCLRVLHGLANVG